MRLLEACPADLTLLFILDRGYARVSLIQELLRQPGVMFLMRAPKNVVVRYLEGGTEVQRPLGKIPILHGQMMRLTHAFYRKTHLSAGMRRLLVRPDKLRPLFQLLLFGVEKRQDKIWGDITTNSHCRTTRSRSLRAPKIR